MKRTIQILILAVVWIGIPTFSWGQSQSGSSPTDQSVAESGAEAPADAPIYESGGTFGQGLVLGARFDLGVGEPLNGVGTAYGGELEVGYTLPALSRSIEIFVQGSYGATPLEGKSKDARFPDDGSYSYTGTRRQGELSLGALYRLDVGVDWLRPYGSLGPRMYMWQAELEGTASGQAFGQYMEQGTNWGVFIGLGADFFVGPGSISFEIQGDWAPVDEYILRDTSAGQLGFLLGYRIYL